MQPGLILAKRLSGPSVYAQAATRTVAFGYRLRGRPKIHTPDYKLNSDLAHWQAAIIAVSTGTITWFKSPNISGEKYMSRIFDNIDNDLLTTLRATMQASHHSDFCVGYLNLRGWQAIDDLVAPWNPDIGQVCRVMIGMQRPAAWQAQI